MLKMNRRLWSQTPRSRGARVGEGKVRTHFSLGVAASWEAFGQGARSLKELWCGVGRGRAGGNFLNC